MGYMHNIYKYKKNWKYKCRKLINTWEKQEKIANLNSVNENILIQKIII